MNTYDRIRAELSRLSEQDIQFQQGTPRLDQILAEIRDLEKPEDLARDLFLLLERLPDPFYSAVSDLVTTLEAMHGFEVLLEESVRRLPAFYTVRMVNWVLNAVSDEPERAKWMALLTEVADDARTNPEVAEKAKEFLVYQETRAKQDGGN